jgi:hypothetical protein
MPAYVTPKEALIHGIVRGSYGWHPPLRTRMVYQALDSRVHTPSPPLFRASVLYLLYSALRALLVYLLYWCRRTDADAA